MTHPAQITDPATILRFIMAGKAKCTVVSKKTGTRFTYKVSAPRDGGDIRFVSVLNGPDNYENYQYIGFIPKRDTNGLVAGNKGKPGAPSFVAMNWVLTRIAHAIGNGLPEIAGLEFWHEGACAACGRKLTVPASIATGFGPTCADKLGIPYGDPDEAWPVEVDAIEAASPGRAMDEPDVEPAPSQYYTVCDRGYDETEAELNLERLREAFDIRTTP